MNAKAATTAPQALPLTQALPHTRALPKIGRGAARRIGPALAGLALLGACSAAPRYEVILPVSVAPAADHASPASPPAPRRIAARSVMLRELSLPDYAAAAEILVEGRDGAISGQGRAAWADDPVRGWTLALARRLDQLLLADVASEPWPLAGLPEAEITLRISEALAGADGQFRLEGSLYIASDLYPAMNGARPFHIRVPIEGQGPAAIAAAQGAALARLADETAAALR